MINPIAVAVDEVCGKFMQYITGNMPRYAEDPRYATLFRNPAHLQMVRVFSTIKFYTSPVGAALKDVGVELPQIMDVLRRDVKRVLNGLGVNEEELRKQSN